eukprot:SAG11_NODE_21231_length_429_cov_0.845455_1_plen_51_part_10
MIELEAQLADRGARAHNGVDAADAGSASPWQSVMLATAELVHCARIAASVG